MRAIFVMIKCEMGQAYRVARDIGSTSLRFGGIPCFV